MHILTGNNGNVGRRHTLNKTLAYIEGVIAFIVNLQHPRYLTINNTKSHYTSLLETDNGLQIVTCTITKAATNNNTCTFPCGSVVFCNYEQTRTLSVSDNESSNPRPSATLCCIDKRGL